MRNLQCEFEFAGFTFPRYIAGLTPLSKLKAKAKSPVGQPYHAPRPNTSGYGGYLKSVLGAVLELDGLRCRLANDVNSDYGRMRGPRFYCDAHQDQTMEGLVVYLSHGRYLAGWTMGEGMATFVDTKVVYTNLDVAAFAAHSCAEYAAEREREDQEEQEDLARRLHAMHEQEEADYAKFWGELRAEAHEW